MSKMRFIVTSIVELAFWFKANLLMCEVNDACQGKMLLVNVIVEGIMDQSLICGHNP